MSTALLAKLKMIYNQLLAIANVQTIAGENLYKAARAKLGTDASPKDLADDAYGCMETVSTIYNGIDPTCPVITGTYTGDQWLSNSTKFVRVKDPIEGDILMYATGTGGGKNGIVNGHVGIIGDLVPGGFGDRYVMSNNSSNGIFDNHFTIASMRKRYRDLGGYPEHIYRKII